MRAPGQRRTVRIQVPTSNALLAKRATATSEEDEKHRGADNDGEDRPKPAAWPNGFHTLVQRKVSEIPIRPARGDNHNPTGREEQSPPQTQGLRNRHSRRVYADADEAAP
jgi:hypothetical protein